VKTIPTNFRASFLLPFLLITLLGAGAFLLPDDSSASNLTTVGIDSIPSGWGDPPSEEPDKGDCPPNRTGSSPTPGDTGTPGGGKTETHPCYPPGTGPETATPPTPVPIDCPTSPVTYPARFEPPDDEILPPLYDYNRPGPSGKLRQQLLG